MAGVYHEPPRWAKNLVARVAEDYGIPEPELRWRQKEFERLSHGHKQLNGSRRRMIYIAAGVHQPDARMVVLHEMAHCLYNGSHDAIFWTKAIELFKRYDVPLSCAIQRDGDTRGFQEAWERWNSRSS